MKTALSNVLFLFAKQLETRQKNCLFKNKDQIRTICGFLKKRKKLKPLYINDFSLSEDGPSGET